MKARRALWSWGVAVLALHLLVLSALPRQAAPLAAPAKAQAFTTRTVPLPVPGALAALQPAALAVPAPRPLPAERKRPAARENPPRPPTPAVRAAAPAALPAAADSMPDALGPGGGAPLDSSPALALPADGTVPAQGQPPAPGETVLMASAGANADAGADTAPASAAAPDPAAGSSAPPPPPAPAAAQAPARPEAPARALAPGAVLAIFAPGSEQPQPGPAPAVQVPAPQQLNFHVAGQARKLQYSARAELVWQHDGQRYQARQEVGIVLLGARTQTSTGTLGPAGLQPERFGDRARSEKAAHFDYTQHRVTFSANTPDAPLAAGTQDRLSVFVQLGALLAAAPERYPPGTRIRLDTAGTSNVDAWTFTVEGEETLDLPVGSVRTLRLQRLPRPGHDYDQQAQVWLAPTLGYLPARIRLTQANGDYADLRLSGHAALH